MAQLPILQFEEKIIETVEQNQVVVIIGETGSGKSTQLSQMLHRRGYTKSGIIGVTQPRRVAAVSVARRVAEELGVQLGEEVGYAIRFEDRTSERTRIKYLTDGVLLRESLSDPELGQYSVIILDEAHERSLNTDTLMGLMKRLIRMRNSHLKVLITSATLDGDKVSKFFFDCPVLTVPGKLYPVEILYSNERPKSYIESCLKTAIDIHTKEPEGDVLIFLTGQDDIEKLVSKLEEKVYSLEEGSCMDAIILPLHGSLPPELQVRVFSCPPPNCRRFIAATNIAETSLTVDGVVYVIDSGYVKQRQYNPSTGMYSLDVVQISKVQANQRAGRAGRTRPGKCYRMYTSMDYQEELLDVTVPEIQRSSLAGSVLYLKSLDLPDIDILKFDFLDPPTSESLEDALKQLYLIDAIDENGSITRIGQTMAELPLEPSLSRTLIEANEYGCISQALTVVAMLSAETTLLPGHRKNADKKRKHRSLNLPDGSGWGDHIQLLQIFELWDQKNYDVNWCKDHDLQVRGMLFVKDVRKQLCQIMQKIAKGSLDVWSFRNQKESQAEYWNLRKALCVGYANRLAERMIHHNGYRTLSFKPQVVQVHPSSVMKPDEDGKFADYVVYHELITTSRPYMRNVCAVQVDWVMPILNKVKNLNVNKLSGGSADLTSGTIEGNVKNSPKKEDANTKLTLDGHENKILAARERFLARRGKKWVPSIFSEMLRVTAPTLAATGLLAASPVLLRWKHGPWKHKVRTRHGDRYFLRAASESRLSAKEIDTRNIQPQFGGFSYEVDKPYKLPAAGCTCFNCKKPVDTDAAEDTYLWIPSGDSTAPSESGYFFHRNCFRCHTCKFRIFGNKFFSHNGHAHCLRCALGKPIEVPNRWWHLPRIGAGRYDSRRTGHEFPRHKKQIDFLYDPAT